MFKVVFDTNLYISAILTPGKQREILNLAKDEKIDLFISEYILEEISRILKEKFDWPDQDIRKALIQIEEVASLVFPAERIDVIKIHPEDNFILGCALAAGADFLISGDKKHILPLKEFRGIKILAPAEFLEIFKQKHDFQR